MSEKLCNGDVSDSIEKEKYSYSSRSKSSGSAKSIRNGVSRKRLSFLTIQSKEKDVLVLSQPISVESDSIGSASSVIINNKMSSMDSKASSLYNNSIDLDDEILVGDEREFHNACRSGDLATVERLIKSDIDINCRNKHDRTPLHWAAGNGYLEIVKLLLDEGAAIDARDKFGMDALLWSAWFGHKSCVQHMIHAGASKSSRNKHGSTWLHCAAQNDRLSVVQLLGQEMQDFDVNATDDSGRSATHVACKYGRKEIVACLIQSGCDATLKDKSGNSSLHTAAAHGHSDVVKLLVDANCDVEDVNGAQQTPLHIAAREGHAAFCQELLQYDIDVNCETEDEICPLHLAVSENRVEACKVLLQHNVDVDSGNKHNQTPLHLAVVSNSLELTTLLVQAGANPSVPDARSETPLHLAAENGLYDITEVLLLANSNHTIKDLKGKTPLDIAARGNYVTIVDMIVKAERHRRFLQDSQPDALKNLLDKISFKPDNSANTQHFRTLLYRLATKYLKPVDWKHLAFYWGFTDRQLNALEEQYTGSKSYREHGHRMLLIWLHGCINRNENPVKSLYEGLIGIQKAELAELMRTKATRTVMSNGKGCCVS